MIVIPAIDLLNGRCVRLLKGDFNKSTDYGGDPLAVAAGYEALGATILHVVDLDGAETGTAANRDAVRRIVAETKLRVQLGGGIRSSGAVDQLLHAGVERIVIGSMAISDPAAARDLLNDYGSDRVVFALDIRIGDDGVPRVTTHGWQRETTVSLDSAIDGFLDAGLRHVLCTDVARDGALTGPNLGLYRACAGRYPGVSFQASGGVRDADDLVALRDTGVSAAITGKAVLEGKLGPAELRQFWRGE